MAALLRVNRTGEFLERPSRDLTGGEAQIIPLHFQTAFPNQHACNRETCWLKESLVIINVEHAVAVIARLLWIRRVSSPDLAVDDELVLVLILLQD